MIRFRRLVVGSRTAGFTVAELVVVVLIIVVIGSVVVPTLIGQIAKAKDGSTQSNIKGISRFMKTANVDSVLSGADCTSTGNVVTSAGSIPKNGAIVCADIALNSYCISQVSASGTIYALTPGRDAPYSAPNACTAATTVPLAAGDNLLTSCEASFELYTTCISPITSYVTVAQSQDWALDGTSSAKYTLGAPATVTNVYGWIAHPAVNPLYVTAGRTYTAVASVKPGTYTGTVTLDLYYYTSANVYTGSEGTSISVTAGGAWQQISKTKVAPAGTAKIAMFISVNASSTTGGKTLYLDKLGIWEGTSTVWAAPNAS